MITEEAFRVKLIGELKLLFPGVFVLRNDPNQIQGFPDLTILYKKHWAVLECKRHKKAIVQPNQLHYISILNEQSFGRVVYPENMMEVLCELQKTFRS